MSDAMFLYSDTMLWSSNVEQPLPRIQNIFVFLLREQKFYVNIKYKL